MYLIVMIICKLEQIELYFRLTLLSFQHEATQKYLKCQGGFFFVVGWGFFPLFWVLFVWFVLFSSN